MSFASFDIAAVLVCLTCLVYMLLHRRWDKLQSKIFVVIILENSVNMLRNVGWTVRTADRSLTAQWEVQLVVTETGYELISW